MPIPTAAPSTAASTGFSFAMGVSWLDFGTLVTGAGWGLSFTRAALGFSELVLVIGGGATVEGAVVKTGCAAGSEG